MTSYKVRYLKAAEKLIFKHKPEGLRFLKAFAEIAADYPNNIFKYDIKVFRCTTANVFRLRIGKYRAIFQVQDDKILILVFDIDSREDIYK